MLLPYAANYRPNPLVLVAWVRGARRDLKMIRNLLNF